MPAGDPFGRRVGFGRRGERGVRGRGVRVRRGLRAVAVPRAPAAAAAARPRLLHRAARPTRTLHDIPTRYTRSIIGRDDSNRRKISSFKGTKRLK